MNSLLNGLAHNVFRVRSIPQDYFQDMSMSKAVNRYVRAAKERGIDMLFLDPYLTTKNELSVIDYNINFIEKLFKSYWTMGYRFILLLNFHNRFIFRLHCQVEKNF